MSIASLSIKDRGKRLAAKVTPVLELGYQVEPVHLVLYPKLEKSILP
jgi:hypothetical protein